MELPLYKLVINPDDTTGVSAVALVDSPAIKENWIAFNKSKQRFKVDNQEKRIISGALMVPDMHIYRNDPIRGEYNVFFDAPTIEQIVQKFFKNKNTNEVNMMHEDKLMLPNVYMIESFIIDSNRGINTPLGFDKLADGTWFGSFKVDNQSVWDDFIKTGIFKGFSVEGFFNEVPVNVGLSDEEAEFILGLID